MFLSFKSFINSNRVTAYLYINGEYKPVIPYIFHKPKYLYTANGKVFYDGIERSIRLGVAKDTEPTTPVILISSINEVMTDSNNIILTLIKE